MHWRIEALIAWWLTYLPFARSVERMHTKSTSRGSLRAISGAGPRNAQNQPPGASWEPFREQAAETLKSTSRSFLRAISRAALRSSWLALAATSQEIPGLNNFWRQNIRFLQKFLVFVHFTKGIWGWHPFWPYFCEDFRQGRINLSTLRGEFEADIHSDRIFARKSAPGVRARFPAPFIAPLIQDRKNPTGSSCFGSTVWGITLSVTD